MNWRAMGSRTSAGSISSAISGVSARAYRSATFMTSGRRSRWSSPAARSSCGRVNVLRDDLMEMLLLGISASHAPVPLFGELPEFPWDDDMRAQGANIDEKLSRWWRSDPRGVSQAQDRLHHVLARLGVVARVGGIGA